MTDTDGFVAGVDLATAAVRVLVADGAGTRVASASRALDAAHSPRPGRSEQDAGRWWPAVAGALREVTQSLGPRSERIRAVSVSATSGTVVGLDSAGAPVGPALTYADQRARPESDLVREAAAGDWARAGLTPAPSFGLPKWAWMLAAERGREIARLAHAPDLIVAHLIGTPFAPTDYSHALKSGYDPARRTWIEAALEAAGIGPELLPEVGAPSELVGVVGREAADSTGLPPGCEVRLGMTDSCAAQLAAGGGLPGRFVSVLGTTLVLKGASDRPVADPEGAVYSHLHPGGWWLPGGASNAGGGALVAAAAGRDLPGLDRLAAERGPSRCVAYPLTIRGERFPFSRADAQGFVEPEPSDGAERHRALLEGVAFVERLGYERLDELGAPATGPVVTTGRAARSRVWNRIRATVLGRTLEAKPETGTDLGACMLAAAGSLHADLASACSAMTAAGEQVDPMPAEQELLRANYDLWLQELEDRGWYLRRT